MNETDTETPFPAAPKSNAILLDDLRASWRHAVRALNYCENGELRDTHQAMSEIVCKLSQQLEFQESFSTGVNA
jgi:hypothetical protein